MPAANRLSLRLLFCLCITFCSALKHVPRLQKHGSSTAQPLVSRIVYIKTHATGSSTLTNIFHRFCDSYNVSCFVPPYYAGKMADRETLRGLLRMKKTNSLAWDVWPNHAVLESDLFDKLIPNNTKVSLFRNPLDRVVSSWAHSPRELKDMGEMLRKGQTPDNLCGPEGKKMSQQVPPESFDDLDFVIITEYMNLGLVMMKRRFGWKMRDIVYTVLKGTTEADEWKGHLRELLSQRPDRMTNATRRVLHQCVLGKEMRVYNQAVNRFFSQWNRLGPKTRVEVQKELMVFENVLRRVGKCCDEKPSDEYCIELREDNLEWVHEAHGKHLPELGCRKILNHLYH